MFNPLPLTATFAVVLSAHAAVSDLSDSIRQVNYQADTLAPINITPTFDNGYLVVYGRDHAFVYAPGGTLAYSISREGNNILNVAVDTDGTAAAAVNFGEMRGGISVIDPKGSRLLQMDTGKFLPAFVCFAADHSIWTTGMLARRNLSEGLEYFMLRHYSQDGKQLGAFLPRSSFKADGEPATGIIGLSGLRATADRIGAFLTYGGDRTKALWVETDLAGNEIGRWRMDIDGRPVALTPEAVYAQIGWGALVALDRPTGKWKPVNGQSEGVLLAVESQYLIFMVRGRPALRLVPFSIR